MSAEAVKRIEQALSAAAAAKKCHPCGCFQDAVTSLGQCALASPLANTLQCAEATFEQRRYDCLGCHVCWPADGLNAAAEVVELPTGARCPIGAAEHRDGWPPFPGDYCALRFSAPVAVCTLHTQGLVDELSRIAPDGLSIVGSLQTENLGIERIVQNVVANPHLRVLLLCGEDTAGKVGHLPGQSLMALVQCGTDDDGRIVGAEGKRPVLRNVQSENIEHFRRQVRVIDVRGLVDAAAIADRVTRAAATAKGPMADSPLPVPAVRVLTAEQPDRLILDPKGYVVVIPDRRRQLLVAEHYDSEGLLGTVVEGADPVRVMATLLGHGLVTRADHAAYLSRELTLARRALDDGTPYVQDRAPEPIAEAACGPGCGCVPSVATILKNSTRS
jgi:tetrahydromethanopterin S-methyltransferase subunit A